MQKGKIQRQATEAKKQTARAQEQAVKAKKQQEENVRLRARLAQYEGKIPFTQTFKSRDSFPSFGSWNQFRMFRKLSSLRSGFATLPCHHETDLHILLQTHPHGTLSAIVIPPILWIHVQSHGLVKIEEECL